MKNFIISLIVLSIAFFSCKNAFEKEDGEIESLHQLIDNAEEVLLSVDTSKTFPVIREMKKGLWNFGNKYDSLDKEVAFKVADYYGNKKLLYFIFNNYTKLANELNIARKQLDALKTDLNNGVITKEQFVEYYKNEQEIIINLA